LGRGRRNPGCTLFRPLRGSDWLLVGGDEIRELVRIFARDDLGLGIDAGFEGIKAGGGLALDGARASGSLGVLTVRLVLFGCCHDFLVA
jgi:hypothetical protein